MNRNKLQEYARSACYVLYKESEEERQAGRFELFLDLLCEFAIYSLGNLRLTRKDVAVVASFSDELVFLWAMALLVLYANNANANAADEDIEALRTTAGAYLVARFTTVCTFLVTSVTAYQHRTQARLMAGFMFVGLLITIPLFFESVSLRAKVAVVAIAIVYQEVTWAVTLTYSTAVDIAHEVDRMAVFSIIILGEFVYSIIVDNKTGIGLTAGYAKAAAMQPVGAKID
ncbi:hypothetical protein QQZ08_009879 [Neonectria magnoliae]|uniref:Low temperature requirement A n=1 Tax=Neonectria magnoliae TaxID=2732573 RepID=A0ABR1HKJ3_9HYPO